MSLALLFPGQGSQYVGMGQDLAREFAPAREVFEEVDEALGLNLARLIFAGSEAELTRTDNCQPALMAHSMAVLRVLEAEIGLDPARDAAFVAGHSLGEYSALCAGGGLGLADCARLLRRRGLAMQAAVRGGEGGMAALMGLAHADVEALIAESLAEAPEGAVLALSGDNAPGQLVIAGHRGPLARAMECARARGARRVVPLAVSAPFHTELMAPAAERVAAVLAATRIASPAPPVIGNANAAPETDPEALRAGLVAQMTGCVRWRESIETMVARGVDAVLELGAGRVLGGLCRRIAPDLEIAAAAGPGDLGRAAAFVERAAGGQVRS